MGPKSVATPTRRTAAHKRSPLSNKASRPRQQWNAYLTEDDRFKLTAEEVAKKQQLLVSKHNIFSEQYVAAARTIRSKGKKAQNKQDRDVDKDKENRPGQENQRRGQNADHDDALDLLSENSDVSSCRSPAPQAKRKSREKTSASPWTPGGASHSAETRLRASAAPTLCSSRRDHPSSAPSFSATRRDGAAMANDFLIQADDTKEIVEELCALQRELRYYEQLAGKRSVLQPEELDELDHVLTADNLASSRTVVKFLLQLVCKSMSYLLEKELQQDKMEKQIASMQSALHQLMKRLDNQVSAQSQSLPLLSSTSQTPLHGAQQSLPNPLPIGVQPLLTQSRQVATSAMPQTAAMVSCLPLLSSTQQRVDISRLQGLPSTQETPACTVTAQEAALEIDAAFPGAASLTGFSGTSTSDWLFLRTTALETASNGAVKSSVPFPPMVTMPPPAQLLRSQPQPYLPVQEGLSSRSPSAKLSPHVVQQGGDVKQAKAMTAMGAAPQLTPIQTPPVMYSQPPSSWSSSMRTAELSAPQSVLAREEGIRNTRDSYDTMIDRLSYNLSNHLLSSRHPAIAYPEVDERGLSPSGKQQPLVFDARYGSY